MTREDLKKIAMRYAHDELKDNHASVETIVEAAFLNGIDYAEHHPHWISVEDELPKVGKWVLIHIPTDKPNVYTTRVDIGEGEHWRKYHNVTHWTPLPQPPMKGDQDND